MEALRGLAHLNRPSYRTIQENAAWEPDLWTGCSGLCHRRIDPVWLRISSMAALSSILILPCEYMIVPKSTWLPKISGNFPTVICTTQPPYASLVHVLRLHIATYLPVHEP